MIEEKLEVDCQSENVNNYYDENLVRVPGVYPGHCQCLDVRNNNQDVRRGVFFC